MTSHRDGTCARMVAFAIALWLGTQVDVAHADCNFSRYRWEYTDYTFGVQPFSEGRCMVCGFSGECGGSNFPDCPTVAELWADKYDCADGGQSIDPNTGLPATQPMSSFYCTCSPSHQAQMASQPHDDEVVDYQCSSCDNGICIANEPDEPQRCEGRQCLVGTSGAVDPGCGNDAHTCTQSHGRDDFPVNLSSGRVESQPITLFSLPAPEGLEFGFTIKYDSHARFSNARKLVTDTVPTVHHADEVTHTVGRHWRDSFGDRLMIRVFGLGDPSTPLASRVITWVGFDGIVTFRPSGMNLWKSTTGKFELIDRVNPGAFGRWMIRSTDTSGPQRIWTFEEVPYTTYDNVSETVARLKARALTGNGDVPGFYGYTLTWTSNGTIDKVTDTLGRELAFQYSPWSNGTMFTLSTVSYRPNTLQPTNSELVATLTQVSGGQLLDRVDILATGSYRRFLYPTPTGVCRDCGFMLGDVIAPILPSSTAPQAPVSAAEVVLEHHVFEIVDPLEARRPRAIESSGPGRHYAYEWNDVNGHAVQYDLTQPQSTCTTSCPIGEKCRGGTCYVAQQIDWTPSLRLPERNHPFGASSNIGSGNTSSLDMIYDNDPADGLLGAPRRSTQPDGSKTANGYDSLGRLRCIVRGDGQFVGDEAFANPSLPDTSACVSASGAQVVQVDYTTSSISKTTPSLFGTGNVTETQFLDRGTCSGVANGTGYSCSVSTSGTTHDIDGSASAVTVTTTRTYDAIGRIIETNGPLDDAVALDKKTITYHTDNSSFDFGYVQSVTRYVGTSASSIALTTTYSDYDEFGVPHRITGPNGDYVTYAPSPGRLTWTITHMDANDSPISASTVQLNGDGTVLSTQDADGVCMTYEYSDATGYVGVPTVIKRDTATCGTIPIDTNSGEVEVRTYVAGDASRLESVQRRNNGTVEFSYSGFTYDRDRRLVSAATLDSATPFTFGFTDVLPSSTIAPGGPANGAWRTDTEADEFGRPTQLLRYIDASNKQTYTYEYATPFTPRPTTLSRGLNGSATSVTQFVYDDFGRLVETIVPEAGTPGTEVPTRYEYDIAGRMIRKRVGISTPLVRTSVYTYDSLGRTTHVDHDFENSPVDCASEPDGTPIQDEEYRYDDCTEDAPSNFACNNARGKLTIARAIVQCSSGVAVRRGRWYDYDTAGRVARVGYATVTGTSISSAQISEKAYTAAGRLQKWTSPIVNVYGTQYVFDSSGRPGAIKDTLTSQPAFIATGITYRAFGPLQSLATESAQPVGSGSRRLALAMTYRSDDSIQMLDWTQVGDGVSSIALLKDQMTYGPAGLLSLRRDLADNLSSRYYGYDALLRMRCEARGISSTLPSESKCTQSSTQLAGLYTYGNGSSATQPPDVRLTSFIRAPAGWSPSLSYTSPSTETYTYSNGSGQTQQINRTGGNIIIGYDALGRRAFEYISSDPTYSRRDYTYLPNGQLGSVAGYDQSNQPYTVTVRYDTEGRPETIMHNTTPYTLYWDDANRLIVARIGSGVGATTWNYHYLGNLLVSATRYVYLAPPNPPEVKRFWYVTDERGLIYRVLDEQGATYWQARWDATGARYLVGTPVANMWTPFALPGQIMLEGTEAFWRQTSAVVRPAIALNQWRAYDPLTSSFMHSDSADLTSRLTPEGYSYGRNNPVEFVDASGKESRGANAFLEMTLRSTLVFEKEECASRRDEIIQAAARAYLDISKCVLGLCAFPGGEAIRRHWLFNLARNTIHCPPRDTTISSDEYVDSQGFGHVNTMQGPSTARAWTPQGASVPTMYIAPVAFDTTRDGCLANTIAHEALHATTDSTDWTVLYGPPSWLYFSQSRRSISHYLDSLPLASEEMMVELTAGRHTTRRGLVQSGNSSSYIPFSKGCVTCD